MEVLKNVLPNQDIDTESLAGKITTISNELCAGGLRFKDDIAIQIALAVHQISFSEFSLLRTQMQSMLLAYSQLPSLIQDNTLVQQWLRISSEKMDLALQTLGGSESVSMAAFDLMGGRIIDPNIDKTDVIGLIDPIQDVFTRQFPGLIDIRFRSLDSALRSKLEDLTGKKRPKVFILTESDNPFDAPQRAFAQKHNFDIGTIDDFNALIKEPGAIDIVVRTMSSRDIFDDPEKYKILLDALANGLPMINPLMASFASNKALIPLLIYDGALNSEWFCSPRLIQGEQAISSSGNFIPSSDLAAELISNRKRFVIKEARPGGRVFIGAASEWTQSKWCSLVAHIIKTGDVYVVEDYYEQDKSSVMVGTRRNIRQEVKVKRLDLRGLLKVYAFYGQPDYIIAEMILGMTRNINGSGFTIPVAFSE